MHNPVPISLRRLEQEHRYLELLVRAGEILATALDWHQTIESVCNAAVETVADICLLDLKDESGKLHSLPPRTRTRIARRSCAMRAAFFTTRRERRRIQRLQRPRQGNRS